MELMTSALKDEVHALVDEVPESELKAARRYLEYLRDQGEAVAVAEHDPFEHISSEERARLHAALSQSEREFAEGRGIPADEVLRELRSSR